MRILQVVEPGVDGVFRHVEGLSRYLLEQGDELALAYSSRRGSDRLEALVREIRERGFPAVDLHVRSMPGPGDGPALVRLWRLIRDFRPEIVHAHSSKAGGLVRILRGVLPWVPVFYTPNAYYGMGRRATVASRLFHMVERLLGRVGTTIHVSTDEADWARTELGLPAARSVLIHNGVDTTKFVPGDPSTRLAWRRKLDIPDSALVLGTIGRLSAQKDPVTLYRGVAPSLREVSELYLCQIANGDPEEIARLEALAAELGISAKIRRLTYLADVLPFYQGIDAFILTSRYEGLSYAVLEALACDLPVLLTDVPGNREFTRFGLSHAWFAPAGEIEPVGGMVSRWLKDRPGERPKNHREIAVAQFDLWNTCGRIRALYERSLQGGGDSGSQPG